MRTDSESLVKIRRLKDFRICTSLTLTGSNWTKIPVQSSPFLLLCTHLKMCTQLSRPNLVQSAFIVGGYIT